MADKSSKRIVSTWEVALITLGAAAASSGTFILVGSAAQKAGSGTLLAIFIAGLIVLASAASGTSLASAIPITGGVFIWARKLGHPWLAYIAGIAFLLIDVVEQSVNALMVVLFAQLFFPGLPLHLLAAGIMLFVTFLNYTGLNLATELLSGLTLISACLIIVIVTVLWPSVHTSNLSPILGNHGVTGILGASGAVFFAIGGFERALVMASEIENPKKGIPLAIMIAYPISILLFFILSMSIIGTLGAKTSGDTFAVVNAWRVADGNRWVQLPILAGMLAACITLGVGVLGASQVAMEMGLKGELPKWFFSFGIVQ